tara:strand:+ start:1317 stop:1727 length:411 start_codon:yes stop_codon:yes gene_type:complete
LKKKNWSLTTLIVAISIVILCYFAYQKFIYPIYLKNELQTTEISLKKGEEVLLSKVESQKKIYSIEIEFTGQLKSNTTIFLCDSIGIPNQQIRLKKGEINQFYFGDWYSSSCKLKFDSKEELRGNLKIDYRFLAVD